MLEKPFLGSAEGESEGYSIQQAVEAEAGDFNRSNTNSHNRLFLRGVRGWMCGAECIETKHCNASTLNVAAEVMKQRGAKDAGGLRIQILFLW